MDNIHDFLHQAQTSFISREPTPVDTTSMERLLADMRSPLLPVRRLRCNPRVVKSRCSKFPARRASASTRSQAGQAFLRCHCPAHAISSLPFSSPSQAHPQSHSSYLNGIVPKPP